MLVWIIFFRSVTLWQTIMPECVDVSLNRSRNISTVKHVCGGDKSLGFFLQFVWREHQKTRESTAGHLVWAHVKLSRRAWQQAPLVSACSPDTYLPRQSLPNFPLLLPRRLCDSPLARPTIWPFSSLNVSASFKHVALPSQPSFLCSHYRLLSLGQAELKGGERVCVKWDLYCSPSSNTLSLEWAGNNPWGLVQSNCNPQHIPLAGSPLHCCSGAGAGGARAHTRRLPFPLIC